MRRLQDDLNGSMFFTGKIPFTPGIGLKSSTIEKTFDFAYDMTFNKQGEHRNHRSGGTHVRRQGEIFADTFQGKLAEFAIYNHLISKREDIYYNSTPPENYTLTGLLFLFLYNEIVGDLKNYPYFAIEGASFDLCGMIEKNSNACEAAIRKVMRVTKKCIEKPAVINKNILERLYSMLKNILGKDRAKNIIEEFELNK